MKAPWVKHFYFTGLNSYILPNVDTVVLGGTTQKNSWDTTVSHKVRCPSMVAVHTIILFRLRYLLTTAMHEIILLCVSSLPSELSTVLFAS